GARGERRLYVVRDGVSRGPRQGPAGRSARALRGVQQRVCGQRWRRRAGRCSLRRSPAGTRGVGSPGRRGAGVAIRPTAPRPRSGRAPGARSAAATPAGARPPPPSAAPSAPPGQRMTGPLRPVNPFMVQDPKQKARRLARALVSDLVVYHPEKRQQGLRDGTLPQLFKDEIEKSWQEYVEQVGAEIAKSTPFWAEALNEILAGGNKVF